MLDAGAFAPDFQLEDLDGQSWDLQRILSGGPTLIAFQKVSCPVCRYTFPFLERLHQGRSSTAPRIVAISQDDAPSTRGFNQALGVTFPTLLDSQARKYPAGNAFRIANVPSLFLIEADRRISLASHGFVKSELEDLGVRFGVAPFREGETIPAMRPG